jgi:hypothetical protein
MIYSSEVKKLFEGFNKGLKRANIVVHPPIGEDDILNANLFLNFVFQDETGLSIKVDDDNWSLIFKEEVLIPKYPFQDFPDRMIMWMKKWNMVFDYFYEVYDLTDSTDFDFLFKENLIKINLLKIKDSKEEPNSNYFGIEFIFSNENYLICGASHEGASVETRTFLKENDFKNKHKWLGKLEKREFINV